MGKRSVVVIDIGRFNTKICVFQNLGQKYVLQNGYFYRSDLVQREELAFSHLFTSSVDILRIANDLEQLDIALR
jgi:hypothetical protein